MRIRSLWVDRHLLDPHSGGKGRISAFSSAGYCESELGWRVLLLVPVLLLRHVLVRMLRLILRWIPVQPVGRVFVWHLRRRVFGRAASLFGCWRQPLAGATPLFAPGHAPYRIAIPILPLNRALEEAGEAKESC